MLALSEELRLDKNIMDTILDGNPWNLRSLAIVVGK